MAQRPPALRLNTPGLVERGLHKQNPYPDGFEKMDMVPAGRCRGYAVEKFTLTDRELGLSNLRAIRDGQPFAVCPPGNYTRLVHGQELLMSDTPMEAWTNKGIVDLARKTKAETVLVAGLGLGMVARALLDLCTVRKLTIVEISAQVAHLVGTYWAAGLGRDQDVEFQMGSIYDFQPAKRQRWDLVYYDIWAEAGDDVILEARQLVRQFKSCATRHYSWPENFAELMW